MLTWNAKINYKFDKYFLVRQLSFLLRVQFLLQSKVTADKENEAAQVQKNVGFDYSLFRNAVFLTMKFQYEANDTFGETLSTSVSYLSFS